jgi:lambda repressor-like predicted transcriptional regulator
MCVRELLINNGVTVNQLACQLHVNRSAIYQSIDGDGSRCIRIVIARIIGSKPSELWADNPVFKKTLDDALFSLDSDSLRH